MKKGEYKNQHLFKRIIFRMLKSYKQASITVETTIVMSVVIFVFAQAINLSIYLYRDGIKTSMRQIRAPAVSCSRLLRIKHMGGDLYEQYKEGDYI